MPAAVVTADTFVPVALSVAVTDAPGMIAPLESVTKPLIAPRPAWARRRGLAHKERPPNAAVSSRPDQRRPTRVEGFFASTLTRLRRCGPMIELPPYAGSEKVR